MLAVKVYSDSNVPCPNLAVWERPSNFAGWPGAPTGGSPAYGILFNGLTHDGVLAGRPATAPQCCTPTHGPFTPYNAVTHSCCSDGTVAPNGTC